jgi:hypothetical protein
VGALAYLEWCYARHQLTQILHSPLRLVIWVPYTLLIVLFVIARLIGHHGPYTNFELPAALATTIGGVYLAMLGATIGFAAGGRVALFRSNSEAVLFSNAGIRPLTVAVWLQLRKLATSWTRWLGGFVYLFAIAAPHDPRPLSVLRAFVAAALALAVQMTVELPVFLMSRDRWREPLRFGGWTLAAIGATFAGAGVFGPRVLHPLVAYSHVDPGAAVVALLHGSTFATVGLAIVVAMLIGSIALLGDDSMPELTAASQNMLSEQRRRSRPARPLFNAPKSGNPSRIPTGALALLWKDWIGFRRGRGTFRLWLVGCTVWALIGAGVAYGTMQYGDQTPLYTLGATTALLVLVLAPYGASVGLANDLSKPLFWLSRSSLQERLAAWTFGRAWRGGVSLGLAPFVAGLASGNIALAIIASPLTLTTYWSLQALGVGLFAIFPNPVDSRGPVMMLRLLATGIYVLPACIVSTLCALSASGPYVATLAFVFVMGMEGWLVVQFSSFRFKEYGASLATISRAT